MGSIWKDLLLLVLFVVAFVLVEETPQQMITNIHAWIAYFGGLTWNSAGGGMPAGASLIQPHVAGVCL